MPELRRWDTAITHSGDDLKPFVEHYFADETRNVLFIGGAGFDPRSPMVAELIAPAARGRIRALLVKEARPESDTILEQEADANTLKITAAIPDHRFVEIEIFQPDGSVIGGRRVATALSQVELDGITDVVVDISALSVGISFPTIRYFQNKITAHGDAYSLHVFVAHQPELDNHIQPVPADKATTVHGFAGKLRLTAKEPLGKLWLPQLAKGRARALQTIHAEVAPNEVCPIIPFPSTDPRFGDELLYEIRNSGEAIWEPDPRDLVYADEGDPLDLYRTILRLHQLRQEVFAGVGGSQVVLSPIGSKVMALGALMAAIEEDLPVVYVEDFSYETSPDAYPTTETVLKHVWLESPT